MITLQTTTWPDSLPTVIEGLTHSGHFAIVRTMSGKPNSDRRSLRRDATRAEIVAAAWQMPQGGIDDGENVLDSHMSLQL